MQIINVLYSEINWDEIPITKHSGETGYEWRRTFEKGNICIRLTAYSPGYKSEHWCCRGHVIHMLEGEVIFQPKTGSEKLLEKGMTCCFSDNQENPHKLYSISGSFLLIID